DALGIREFPDVNRHGLDTGQLRRTEAPLSGHNLIGLRVDGPDEERHQHTLSADGFCQFVERFFVQSPARIQGALDQLIEREISILILRHTMLLLCGSVEVMRTDTFRLSARMCGWRSKRRVRPLPVWLSADGSAAPACGRALARLPTPQLPAKTPPFPVRQIPPS